MPRAHLLSPGLPLLSRPPEQWLVLTSLTEAGWTLSIPVGVIWIEVGRHAHSGQHHSLAGILDGVSGEWELSGSRHSSLSASWWWIQMWPAASNSCHHEELCLEVWAKIHTMSLELPLSRYFIFNHSNLKRNQGHGCPSIFLKGLVPWEQALFSFLVSTLELSCTVTVTFAAAPVPSPVPDILERLKEKSFHEWVSTNSPESEVLGP